MKLESYETPACERPPPRIMRRFHAPLLLLLVFVSCRPPAASVNDHAASTSLGDSVVLERKACVYFGPCPAYRVRIAIDGRVHFESRSPQDSGRVAETIVARGAVLALFQHAPGLDLDSLPSRLMGRAHYCRIVASDAPSVVLEWFKSDRILRV